MRVTGMEVSGLSPGRSEKAAVAGEPSADEGPAALFDDGCFICVNFFTVRENSLTFGMKF